MHRGGVQATGEPWVVHVVDTCLRRLDGQAKDPSNLRGRVWKGAGCHRPEVQLAERWPT